MREGWGTWVKGGAHERGVGHMGEGWDTWVKGGAHGRGVGHTGEALLGVFYRAKILVHLNCNY